MKHMTSTFCTVLVFAFCNAALAASWDVPGDFYTIQDGIDSPLVVAGDRIVVGPGQHRGAIVTKAVEIKGTDAAIINSGFPLTSYKSCGTIDLDIGFQFGFVESAGDGVTISHFKFEGLAFPVFSRGASNVTVTQTTMIDAIQGITNWSGTGWDISLNEIVGLRTANGGGIGILVGDGSGGTVEDNVVSHNKVSGTLHVAECDAGGYTGTGIVLYADWRYGRSGAEDVQSNRIVKNKISPVSDNASVVDVNAIELTEAENPGGIVIHDNAVGFNDLRGTASQLVFSPAGLDNPTNDISRNLGENRGQGLHPSAFGPGGN